MLPVKQNETAAQAKSVIARAMERLQAHQAERRRVTRLGFLIDATGSRSETWEQAQVIQASIFRAVAGLGSLSLRLIHYGGNVVTDHGWIGGPRDVAAAMSSVRCERGMTQILSGLTAFLDAPAEERPAAVILIGDCFEEDAAEAGRIARALKQASIRVFCFQEGEDWAAENAFKLIAQTTGGTFAKFGSALPLADLCAAVAALTAGGTKALLRLPDSRAKQLLLTGPSGK